MGPAIQTALEALLRDIRHEGGPAPYVDDKPWQDWPAAESVVLASDDGSATGVWLDGSLPEPEQLVHLADQVQGWVIEECGRRRLPTNWPRCSAHPDTHPLAPAVVAGRATWVCPQGRAAARPIGG